MALSKTLKGAIAAGGLLVAVLAPAMPAGAGPAKTVAVFDFELINTSLEGEVYGTRPDEAARLKLISDELRRLLGESGRYLVIDQSPAAAEIAEAGFLHGCNGCAAGIARKLGAETAITGTVQKVSNLILSINVSVRDAETGKLLQGVSVDIRGNTDKSWTRGVSYLARNRLLRQ